MITTHKTAGVFLNPYISSDRTWLSLKTRGNVLQTCERKQEYFWITKHYHTVQAVVSGGKQDVEYNEVAQIQDFCVASSSTSNVNELKLSVEVSGVKTQLIFDNVFSKLVADAQPIPGFRRIKGGKTPDIPRDILLQVLGASKVYKHVIKKIINSTVAEYTVKEGLTVRKDLSVLQSLEELEAKFEPGENFCFDAVVQLQEINLTT